MNTFNEERAEERFAFAIAEAKAEEANRCADILSAKADQFDDYIADAIAALAAEPASGDKP